MHNLPFSLQNATAITTVPHATLTWLCTTPQVTSVEECVMTASTILWATIVSSAGPFSTSILRGTFVTPASVTVRNSSCYNTLLFLYFVSSFLLFTVICFSMFLSGLDYFERYVWLDLWTSLSLFVVGLGCWGEEHGVWNTWSLKWC